MGKDQYPDGNNDVESSEQARQLEAEYMQRLTDYLEKVGRKPEGNSDTYYVLENLAAMADLMAHLKVIAGEMHLTVEQKEGRFSKWEDRRTVPNLFGIRDEDATEQCFVSFAIDPETKVITFSSYSRMSIANVDLLAQTEGIDRLVDAIRKHVDKTS